MNRATERERENYIRIKGCSTIYDTRSEANMAKAISKLAAYEDTGLDPCEIVKLKAERDAAVRALEGSCHECKHYTGFHHRGKCINCRHDFYGARGNSNWEWRGPQQEET